MVVLFGLQFSESFSVGKALLSVTGVGRAYTNHLCQFFGLTYSTPLREISRDTLKSLVRKTSNERLVLLALRREVVTAIKLKSQLRLYQGIRHNEGLPVRGQNTKANARTSRRLKNASRLTQKG
jgi:small subunit ribosomal protein S13